MTFPVLYTVDIIDAYDVLTKVYESSDINAKVLEHDEQVPDIAMASLSNPIRVDIDRLRSFSISVVIYSISSEE